MKIFLIHKKGLTNRLLNILSLLDKSQNVKEIEVISIEHEDYPIVKFAKRSNYKFLPKGSPKKKLSCGVVSMTIKHLYVYKKIKDNCDNEKTPYLVIEDDVIFNPKKLDDFIFKFVTFSRDNMYDFVFPGSGANLVTNKKGFYKENRSRCCDSYIVRKKSACLFLSSILEDRCYLPMDWEMNYRFKKLGLSIFWHSPEIFVQGTEIGRYKSEVVSNKKIFRPEIKFA